MFISIEGADGVGKTTQTRLLVDALNANKLETVGVKEPSDTSLGLKVRELVFEENVFMPPLSETALFLADHIQVTQGIKEALLAGFAVVSDRYIDSALVYQGFSKGNSEEVYLMHKTSRSIFFPDITIIIDLPPSIAIERMKQRGVNDSRDLMSIEYHTKIKDGYDTIWDLNMKLKTRKIYKVNGKANEQDVHKEIMYLLRCLDVLKKEEETTCR